MEDLTCMDYLLHCAGHSKHEQITQELLLNALNEFKNIWNLVKKLQSVSRIDVSKITRFLDGVQDGLVKSETKKWEAVSILCVNAEHEYRQIKKYIRPSYLDDYMVVKFINISRGKPKADVKSQKNTLAPSEQHMRKQSFRNNQIYKQHFLKVGKHVSADRRANKSPQNTGLSKTNTIGREIGDGQENACTDNKNGKAGKNHEVVKEMNYSSEAISKSNAENELSESSIKTVDYKGTKKDKHTDDKELNKADTKIVSKDKADNLQKSQHLLANNVESQKTSNVNATNDDELIKELDKDTRNEDQSEFARDGNGFYQSDAVTASKQMLANGVSIEKVKHNHGYHKLKHGNLDPLLETPEETEIDIMNSNKHETNTTINSKKSNDCQTHVNNLHQRDDETYNSNEAIRRQTSEDMTSDGTMKTANQDETSCTNKTSNKGTEINNKSSNNDVGTTHIISDRVTDMSEECNYDELVAKLVVIFEVDWEKAFKILTCCKPSNGLKNSISFLSEILKVSSQNVTNCVENMQEKRKGTTEESNQTLYKQKEVFLKSQLPNLHDEFNIVYGNPGGVKIVQAYAAKCVEISWIMSLQNPPLIFDYESRPMLLEDLFLLFNPYKNDGHLIQYVVWPAVRRCDTGEVIAKGIAEFR